MHSFIIVGDNEQELEITLKKILDDKTQRLNYTLTKIEQVRELIQYVNLSSNTPTAIIINQLNLASIEAQNSFLKSLEEPINNVKFVILTPSEESIIETIRSRCQVIYLKNTKTYDTVFPDFMNLSVGEKIKVIAKIKKRDEAQNFLKGIIYSLHSDITSNNNGYHIEMALQTLKRIEQNGNVSLQVTNFISQTE